MEQSFLLPIDLNGEELDLPAKLVRNGYVSRFVITAEDTDLIFETDEEGEWRILSEDANAKVSQAMLTSITETLRKIMP